jgi:hypothetical protein
VCKCALSAIPCGRGLPPTSIGQGGGGEFTIAPHSFSYVWRYGVQCRGVDGRPGESCFWQSVMVCHVSVQEQLRGWRRGSLSSGRRACVSSRVGLMESRRSHSGGHGDVLSSWTPTVSGWCCSAQDGGTGSAATEETRLTGLTSRRRPVRVRYRCPYPFRGFHRPLLRVRSAGRTRVGGTVSQS